MKSNLPMNPKAIAERNPDIYQLGNMRQIYCFEYQNAAYLMQCDIKDLPEYESPENELYRGKDMGNGWRCEMTSIYCDGSSPTFCFRPVNRTRY